MSTETATDTSSTYQGEDVSLNNHSKLLSYFSTTITLSQAGKDHSHANIMWMVVIVASFGWCLLHLKKMSMGLTITLTQAGNDPSYPNIMCEVVILPTWVGVCCISR